MLRSLVRSSFATDVKGSRPRLPRSVSLSPNPQMKRSAMGPVSKSTCLPNSDLSRLLRAELEDSRCPPSFRASSAKELLLLCRQVRRGYPFNRGKSPCLVELHIVNKVLHRV